MLLSSLLKSKGEDFFFKKGCYSLGVGMSGTGMGFV